MRLEPQTGECSFLATHLKLSGFRRQNTENRKIKMKTQLRVEETANLIEEWTIRVLKSFRFLRFFVEVRSDESVGVQYAQVSCFMHRNRDQKITQVLVETRQNFVRHLLIKIKTFLMTKRIKVRSKLTETRRRAKSLPNSIFICREFSFILRFKL